MRQFKILIIIFLGLFLISCSKNTNSLEIKGKKHAKALTKNVEKLGIEIILRKIPGEEVLEIVNRSLEAQGIDKLNRFEDLTIVRYRETHNRTKKIIVTEYYKFPEKIRIDTTVYFPNKNFRYAESKAYNGNTIWLYKNNIIELPSEKDKGELEMTGNRLKGFLFLFSKGEYIFDEAYEKMLDGEAFYVIKIHSKEEEKKKITIYLDTNSYLPIKQEELLPKLTGFTNIKMTSNFLDYINVNGFKTPSKISYLVSLGPIEQKSEIIVKKAEANTILPDLLFEKPK